MLEDDRIKRILDGINFKLSLVLVILYGVGFGYWFGYIRSHYF